MGLYYGSMLGRAGESMHFLLRSDFEQVRRDGVKVLSPHGNFNFRPRCARDSAAIGPVDLVLVTLKTTANSAIDELVSSLVGAHTVVLTLQNGLGNEAVLAARFGAERVMGALCFVCLNRTAPGVVQHIDHGRITLGEFERWPEPRTHEVAAMFRRAGVRVTVADRLERARWEKLAWNIPFNGLGVAAAAGFASLQAGRVMEPPERTGATTDFLLADPQWRGVAEALMREVMVIAAARGLPLREDLVSHLIDHTSTMGAYKPSTLLDFEMGRELEVDALFVQPWKVASDLRIPSPWLDRLVSVLRSMQGLDPGLERP